MKRRDFLAGSSAIIGIGLVQALEGCSGNSFNPMPQANFSIDLSDSKYAALNTTGGVVLEKGIFIVCIAQSTYAGLSNICTHAGCAVNYNSSAKDFVCPCHGGVYDINGKVVSGPPPAPLSRYKTALNGTTLTITN